MSYYIYRNGKFWNEKEEFWVSLEKATRYPTWEAAHRQGTLMCLYDAEVLKIHSVAHVYNLVNKSLLEQGTQS